jgi:hypothetical protein
MKFRAVSDKQNIKTHRKNGGSSGKLRTRTRTSTVRNDARQPGNISSRRSSIIGRNHQHSSRSSLLRRLLTHVQRVISIGMIKSQENSALITAVREEVHQHGT